MELTPDQPAEAAFDLGPPTEEGAELLAITLTAGKLTQKIERGLRTVSAPLILVPLPAHYDTGMCVRGGQETNDFGDDARPRRPALRHLRRGLQGRHLHAPALPGRTWATALRCTTR